MRCVLPALPVIGPSGKRARRREAARLAQRQGAARRSGKTRPAVAPPRLPESFFALRVLVVRQTQLCSLINKLQNCTKGSALITVSGMRIHGAAAPPRGPSSSGQPSAVDLLSHPVFVTVLGQKGH
jgi:hypothetical protein